MAVHGAGGLWGLLCVPFFMYANLEVNSFYGHVLGVHYIVPSAQCMYNVRICSRKKGILDSVSEYLVLIHVLIENC